MQIIHYHCGVFFQSCVFISFLPSLEIMRWCIIRISLQYNIKKEISKLLFNTFIICYVILFCIVMSKLQQKYLNVVKIIKSKRFKQRTNLFVFTKGICFQKSISSVLLVFELGGIKKICIYIHIKVYFSI